jgi:hypothetical protein
MAAVTLNLCRSATIDALLRARAADALGDPKAA